MSANGSTRFKFYVEIIVTSIVAYIAAWYWILAIDAVVPKRPAVYLILAIISTIMTIGILSYFEIGR